MLKRAFDIAASAVGLLVLGIPLLVVALLVRLDSPGPALFRQVRVGRGGKPFRVLKFRTMRVDASSGPLVTVQGDPRVTRRGATLRRYKIDELPQLVNVLVGDMSLVGPRPEVPEYATVYPEQARVWSVRPGITDPLTLELRNESDLLKGIDDPDRYYREVLLPRKVEGYLRYIDERSFLYDVRVILETVAKVLSGPEGSA